MPLIHLTNFIAAPQERLFDLSRSVSLHKFSMQAFGEQIVGGVRQGLMELNDEVIWTARHLFRNRNLRVKITKLDRPYYFVDEQVTGDFRRMSHEHFFKKASNGTIMIDQFFYELKFGLAGKLASQFYINSYLTKLLMKRNATLKTVAEGKQWQQFITA